MLRPPSPRPPSSSPVRMPINEDQKNRANVVMPLIGARITVVIEVVGGCLEGRARNLTWLESGTLAHVMGVPPLVRQWQLKRSVFQQVVPVVASRESMVTCASSVDESPFWLKIFIAPAPGGGGGGDGGGGGVGIGGYDASLEIRGGRELT